MVEGEVAVLKDGKLVATLGPGDHFGEIALRRDVPADLRATSDGVLYALERADCLAAGPRAVSA